MREDLLPVTWDGKLARLEEEMGEVIKAIGKLRRFGNTPPILRPVFHTRINKRCLKRCLIYKVL